MKKVSTSVDGDAPAPAIGGEVTIELIAGSHPNGELIVERLLVSPQKQQHTFQLLKSPVFVRGIARGDIIQQQDNPRGAFKILQHSGNLCVRVFSKQDFNTPALLAVEQQLTTALEKLGGDLDVSEQRLRVYSIHVSCGFTAIEEILNQCLGARDDVVWFYGNVYDDATGEPLDWWQSILAQA